MPPLAGTHVAKKRLLRTHLRGLTPPPHPYVNAGRLIPKDALAGIKSNGDCFMKQSRLRLENGTEVFECRGFDLWGCSPHAPGNMGCCIPNCASRRRKKATKRKYFAPPFHKKYAQVLCPKGITWEATSTVARGVRRVALQNKSPRILHIRGRAVNEMRYENSIKKEKNAIAFLKRGWAGRLFCHSACAGLANCLRRKHGLLSN